MNLTNHLRRGVLAVAAAASVVGGVGGTAGADNAAAATPLSVPAATTATHAPTPDGAALAAMTAPSPPRSPTATPRNTAVRLTWLRPSSNGGAKINKYRLQRATRSTGPWKTIAKPTVRRYRATGLNNGRRYYFRVAAHNAAGWSTPSMVVSAVPRTVPTAPRSPTATPGNTTVKLTWQRPSSNGGAAINKYAVQRARVGGAWKTVAYPTTRYHTASGLTNGKRYYFRIRAHNTAGWGPYSTTVNAVPRTVPSAPLSVTASPGKEMVALSWSKPLSTGGAKIYEYRVQKATNGGPWEDIAPDSTALGYDAKGLTTADTYSFRVRAHNAAGWSAPSTALQAVPYGVPRVPLNASASVFNDQLTITWSAPTYDGGKPITKYYIYAASSANGPYTHVGTADPPSLKYVYNVHQVDLGRTVYYRIVAENAFGIGPPNQIAVKIPAKVPGAPATCNAVQLGGDGSDTARITWNLPVSDGGTPILFYKIEVYEFNGPKVMETYVWSPTTSYDASPLPVGDFVGYTAFITAYNKVGSGPACFWTFWMLD
jgi:hypothetical protein